MSIATKDIKKLWGRAAGRCSHPGCDKDCISFLTQDVIGEMAHIIAKSPQGPRGVSSGGDDDYDNLILLCPTHHTEIDKSTSGMFSPELLQDWKKRHEEDVAAAFRSGRFSSKQELCGYIKRLLIENEAVWKAYGPESSEAKSNPLSNLYTMWELRKLATIVPNNRTIIEAIKTNQTLLDHREYQASCRFIEHAEGFERNCYEQIEGVARFPKEFEEVINSYVRVK